MLSPRPGGGPEKNPLTVFYRNGYFYRTLKIAIMANEPQAIKTFLRDPRALLPSLRVNRIRTSPLTQATRGGLSADLAVEVRAGARTWKLLCEAKSPGEPRYLAQAITTLRLLQKG